MIQQNDIEKQYGYENIEIESMLCNTCMISYVTKKTKSLESTKNKKTTLDSNLRYGCHHRKPKKLKKSGIMC
jgi:hypothetical protein